MHSSSHLCDNLALAPRTPGFGPQDSWLRPSGPLALAPRTAGFGPQDSWLQPPGQLASAPRTAGFSPQDSWLRPPGLQLFGTGWNSWDVVERLVEPDCFSSWAAPMCSVFLEAVLVSGGLTDCKLLIIIFSQLNNFWVCSNIQAEILGNNNHNY